MDAAKFIQSLRAATYSPFMGVPCSVFTTLINRLGSSTGTEHYICTSEGEAMGLAGGFALARRLPVVYMQNDGFGNAINPLSSLHLLYRLPALLLISWRGEPDLKDAPQHRVMGLALRGLLEQLQVPYLVLEDGDEALDRALLQAREHCRTVSTPFAFIIRKSYFAPEEKAASPAAAEFPQRLAFIQQLAELAGPQDILLGATGFSGRELQQYTEHRGRFYMMGSMGCLPAMGLGLARHYSQRTVFVLDGDGALLMKMGSLATIGHYQPNNFVHVLFDNHAYESTGDQPSVAAGVDFCAVARACGYPAQERVTTAVQFKNILSVLSSSAKPLFIHVRIRSGTPAGLPRPEQPPEQMRDALMTFLD